MAVLDGFVELLMWGLGILQVYLPFFLIGIFMAGIGAIAVAVGARSGMGGKIKGALNRIL